MWHSRSKARWLQTGEREFNVVTFPAGSRTLKSSSLSLVVTAAMMTQGNQEEQWVGARAVLDAPNTPTMSRNQGIDTSSGEPVAEGTRAPDHGAPAGGDPGLIWKGTTWDACPFLCMCCAPVCPLLCCVFLMLWLIFSLLLGFHLVTQGTATRVAHMHAFSFCHSL